MAIYERRRGRRFEEIRFERIHELAGYIEKLKEVQLSRLEGWAGIHWGIREETLHSMLVQLEKAGFIQIGEHGKVKWVWEGEIGERTGTGES